MAAIVLRDYQERGSGEIRFAFRVHNTVVYVLSTGGGKTFLFCYIASSAAEKGRQVMILVHRKELLLQASASLRNLGIEHGIISPHFTPDPHKLVQVASIDTLMQRVKKKSFHVDLLIVDEAHHVIADNKWGRVYELLGRPKMLGVTATPVRTDGKGLGAHAGGLFETMVIGPSIAELIERGMLVNPVVYTSLEQPDLTSLKKTKDGDYSLTDLAVRVDKPKITGSAVAQYSKVCPGARAVVFCASVEHAKHVRDEFNAAGYKFALLVGAPAMSDAERTATNKALKRGELDGVCTVDLISEGYDVPGLECCIMLRPTASEALFLQQCLDDETEILTKRGWLRRRDVKSEDVVAGFDMKSSAIEWCAIDEFIERPLSAGESMYGIASPHLDVRVTAGHDMIVRSYGPTAVNWHKFTAGETAKRKGIFRLPVCGAEEIAPCGLSDDELRFVGWFLTDGTKNKRTNAISISQSAGKPDHCEHIRSTLRGAGLKFGECLVKRTGAFAHCADSIMFTVSKGLPRGNDKHLSGWAHLAPWLDKSMPEIFDRLNSRDLAVMLEAMHLGDGANQHKPDGWTKRTMTITTGDDERAADRLQALCVTRGLRCNKAVVASTRGHADQFFLHINDKQTATIAGTCVPDGSISDKKPYVRSRFKMVCSVPGEIVWCVKNRLGSLVIRRNGKVCVVGNCGRVMRPSEGKRGAWLLDHVGNVGQMIDGQFKRKHGLPSEVREWTLDGRKKGRRKKEDDEQIELMQCSNCFATHDPAPSCPVCGHIYPVKPSGRGEAEQVEGELQQVTAEMEAAIKMESRKAQGKAQTVDELVATLGYSRGRAEKILEARKAKEELRDALMSDLREWNARTGDTTLGILGKTMHDLKFMKPKELRAMREQFDAHRRRKEKVGGIIDLINSGEELQF